MTMSSIANEIVLIDADVKYKVITNEYHSHNLIQIFYIGHYIDK